MAGDEVQPREPGIAQVVLAVRRGVKQRSRLHPILVGRIDLRDQRAGMRGLAFGKAAIGLAGEWVGRGDVGEGENAFREKVVLAIALGAARLRPPVIHVDAVAGADPLHHQVEDDPAVLRLVEAQVSEIVERPCGLGNDLGLDACDVVGQRVGRAEIILGLVAEPGIEVADSRKANAVHGGVLGDAKAPAGGATIADKELASLVRAE